MYEHCTFIASGFECPLIFKVLQGGGGGGGGGRYPVSCVKIEELPVLK